MGHTRLGKPPTTRKWKAVVAAIAGGNTSAVAGNASPLANNVDAVARQVVDAAAPALAAAIEDDGLAYAFFLLTQIALASRTENWLASLDQLGLNVQADDAFFDLLAEFQVRIDNQFFDHGLSSDVGEIGRQAAGEALSALAGDDANTLFGEDQSTVQSAVRPLSTKDGFARLGQEFFGVFMARFLNFYLSRITAAHVGEESLPQLGDLVRFNAALRRHCVESAYIVRDFSGEWYSKTNYFSQIDQQNARGFLAVALKKLQAELARQRDE